MRILYEDDTVLWSGVVEGKLRKAKKVMRRAMREMYEPKGQIPQIPPHPRRVTGRMRSEAGPHSEYYCAYDKKWAPEWRKNLP